MIDWRIIDKSIQGELNKTEKQQLENWLEATESHRQFYERVKAKKRYAPKAYQYAAWRKDFSKNLYHTQHTPFRRQILKYGGMAAAMVVVFLGAYWMFNHQPPAPKLPEVDLAYQEPDRSQVRLTTASGKIIELSSSSTQDTLAIDGIKVARDKQLLDYSGKAENNTSLTAENTIEVPRGGEFRLTLSDGSRIWLNSATRVTYPVIFNGDVRRITLSGEAYFEVAKNEQTPFIVHSNGIEVEVLGTEFNVNTRNAHAVLTTLVKGKVQIRADGQTPVILKPGEQAIANPNNGQVKVSPVNIKKYTAWRNGEFFFENASIEEIMEQLALWYNVEIIYGDNRVRQEKFSGYLLRSESIQSLLKKIEQTSTVHFSVQQNRISITY